jgi:hypothetical protein
MKREVATGAAEPFLVDALDRLIDAPPALRRFVVVEQLATRRFVQACTIDGILVIDLPGVGRTSSERAVASLILDEHVTSTLFASPTSHVPIGEAFSFQKSGVSSVVGASLMVRVLREVHRFTDEIVVRITEEFSEELPS